MRKKEHTVRIGMQIERFSKYAVITGPVLGFICLIPFIVLEIVNRRQFHEGFPYAVFTFTWLLQTVFIWLFLPLLLQLRSGTSTRKNPMAYVLRIISMVFVIYVWIGWMGDQWPCLMGVPNCD